MEKRNEDNVIRILADLVNIPSYGKVDKNHPIIEYLKDAFSDCVEIVELEDSNDNTHLLVGVNHELQNIDNCILLSGHIDTVRESEGHTCNTFLKSNVISGLGTSDMKSFIATLISNKNQFKYYDIPIVFSITSDEETSLKGVNCIISKLKSRNINPSLIVVGEPTNLDYYVSSRGNSIYVDIMSGLACHSGTPELGINAIEKTAEFIMEIKKISKEYERESSICITSVNGGKVPSNIVPDESSVCFGVRTSDVATLNKIHSYLLNKHNEISNYYGDSKLFTVLNIPPFERKDSHFLIEQSNKYNKAMIDARYSTEAGYFQTAFPSSDVVIFGPGDPENIHKAGESINVYNLLQYQDEIIEMINNYIDYKNLDEINIKRLAINLFK